MRKFNVTVNGNVYEVEVEETGAVAAPVQAAAPVAAAAPAPTAVVAPKPAAPAAPAAKKAEAPANGTKVACPMPGTVVGVKVSNGQTVKKGQTLLVLEAMKMENEISSPADGVVTVLCAKGDTTATGDILAVIA
ncbi:MAG: biotin/lipoyl-binding protein [Clostridiaceae bacterium]|jgi:glutaconyl-CoA decarboxylase|nr:biotin/lipoyl-binding protein [Clostridiaceae bacterium]